MSTSFPLGKAGEFPIAEELIGFWKTDNQGADVKSVAIDRTFEGDRYSIYVTEPGLMVSSNLQYHGWITVMEGQTFLVFQEIQDGMDLENYFCYHIEFGENTVTTSELHFEGGLSDEQLKNEDLYRAAVVDFIKSEKEFVSPVTYSRQ